MIITTTPQVSGQPGELHGNHPDTTTGNLDYGWLGQHQRAVEHTPGLRQQTEMGARGYDPKLGRFLQIDPIEGGVNNDYDYPTDPVGDRDLAGRCNSAAAWCILGILTATEHLPTIVIRGKTFVQFLAERGGAVKVKKTKAGLRAMRSDGSCSGGPGSAFFFNFNNACKTHDLGYDLMRFFRSSGSWGSTRWVVDFLFLEDMTADCRGRGFFGSYQSACYRIARTYYRVVQTVSWVQGYGVP